jgi:hypothetical protein
VNLEDDTRIGRLTVNQNLCTIEKIHELAVRDRRITVKLTHSHLHMYLDTIRQSLRETQSYR